VPAFFSALPLFALEQQTILIDLLCLHGRNDTDLIILTAQLTARIGDGVDMKLRCRRLSRKLTQPLCKLFLKIIRELLLGSEENDTALGD
jgi:hypothetical protein